MFYFDWKIKIFPAEYQPPIHQIDETWLLNNFSVEISNDKQSLVNTIKGIFNDEDQKFYAVDMPKYQDAAALAEDNGEELNEDLQLIFVKNTEKAQRLSKLYLKQRRAERRRYVLKLNMRGCVIAPNDTISLTYARFGFVNKIFKVMGQAESLLNEGVSVTIREEDPTIYDWEASEATV